jgi:hypothetical protein
MLLREDLTDADIPHRAKLREHILQEFLTEFGNLKIELAVGCMFCSTKLSNKFKFIVGLPWAR